MAKKTLTHEEARQRVQVIFGELMAAMLTWRFLAFVVVVSFLGWLSGYDHR